MNKQTIDPILIGRNRAIIETWNLMGKRLYTVKTESADLEYNDMVRKDDCTRTIKPIMKYIIEYVDIIAHRLVVLPDNSTIVVELNNDPNLQFKLAPARFAEVTMDKITECIRMNSKKEIGREPIFFRDPLALTEQVNKLNAIEREKADKIAERMLNISQLLETLNKEQTDSCDRYLEELGKEAQN